MANGLYSILKNNVTTMFTINYSHTISLANLILNSNLDQNWILKIESIEEIKEEFKLQIPIISNLLLEKIQLFKVDETLENLTWGNHHWFVN